MERWRKTVESERIRRVTRDPRIEMGMLGNLVDVCGTHTPVIVENLSRDGMLLQSERLLLKGHLYQLIASGNEAVGVRIIWTRGRFAGAAIESRPRAIA